MKKVSVVVFSLLVVASLGAQGLPSADSLKEKAAATVTEEGGVAYQVAREAFNKAVKDIPFANNSSELNLSDPNYSIAGVSIDDFMKNTLIPALVKLVELLPDDKQVTVTGHASKTGSEEATESFQGNIALSQARAEAMVNYIIANSNISANRLKVVAAGSSQPLEGVEPSSEKNCRASIIME